MRIIMKMRLRLIGGVSATLRLERKIKLPIIVTVARKAVKINT